MVVLYRKIICLIALQIFICINLYGQQVKLDRPQVSFHSPDAQNLGRYSEYPTELSTGVKHIAIPIFSIPLRGSKIDLSLSYHSGGIKANQESSVVGLGWVLIAGGEIDRVVREKADESASGFLYRGPVLPPINDIDEMPLGGRVVPDTSSIANAFKSQFDGQPDLYILRAPNLSVQFTLDNNGKFVSINDESINIQFSPNENLFSVYSKEGVLYRFGKSLSNKLAVETTSVTTSFLSNASSSNVDPNISNLPSNVSSWKLTEIISADKSDTVFFEYDKGSYYSFSRSSEMASDVISLTTWPIDQNGIQHRANYKYFSAVSILDVQIISKIKYRSNFVQFNYQRDRLDVANNTAFPTPRLSSIDVLFNTAVVRKFVLDNNHYFERSGTSTAINNMSIPEYNKKSLRLDGVWENTDQNIQVRRWKFGYDETPIPPAHNTNSLDFWGYYNGKSNSSLIPDVFHTKSNINNPIFSGDNRKSDFNYMKAGVLNKIIYPTGGSSSFEYEPNYYLDENQQSNKVETIKRRTWIAINKVVPSSHCDENNLFTDVTESVNTEFTVDEDVINQGYDVGTVSIRFSDYKILPSSSYWPEVKITNLSNGAVLHYKHSPSDMTQTKIINTDLVIRTGQRYKVEVYTHGIKGSSLGLCGNPSIEVYLSYKYWQTTTTSSVVPQQAGGLRIKRQIDYDHLDKVQMQTSYTYGDQPYGSQNIGVGKLYTGIGNYFFYKDHLYYTNRNLGLLQKMIYFSSSSSTELGQNGGCPVFYDKVTVETQDESNSSNGKTEYFYRNKYAYASPLYSEKYRYDNIVYPSWSAPELINEKIYEYYNGIYRISKMIDYVYSSHNVRKIKTLLVDELGPNMEQWDGQQNWGIINRGRYYIQNNFLTIGYSLLKGINENVYVYDSNGVQRNTLQEKILFYNRFRDLSSISITGSTGLNVLKKYKYSGDLQNTPLNNIYSLPTQEEIHVNGKAVGGNILLRRNDGNVEQVFKYLGVSPSTPVEFIDNGTIPSYYTSDEEFGYYPNKNLQWKKKSNGTMTIYLWGYDGQYPIAEIINATYADVVLKLGGQAVVDQLNSISVTDGFITQKMDALRAALPNAQVTSYTYKPLVGMTSKTDARGIIEHYHYDGFQRLLHVLDHVKQIRQSYDYHYRP